MGLIIEELKDESRSPYFDPNFTGSIRRRHRLRSLSLRRSTRRRSESPRWMRRSRSVQEATFKLQSGYAPYRAIWKHIMNVSLKDLKRNYANLDVDFDIWKGRATRSRISGLIKDLQDKGLAYESQGALVVDIAEPTDTKESAVYRENPTEPLSMRLLTLQRSLREEDFAGSLHLCCGQAAGTSFYPGVPCCEEGGDRSGRPEDGFRRFRNDERKGRKAV